MDSFNDVMDAVKAYCKGRVSDASYRVFIQDLNLLNFEGTNIIILEVPNDVVMRFAAARYACLLYTSFRVPGHSRILQRAGILKGATPLKSDPLQGRVRRAPAWRIHCRWV